MNGHPKSSVLRYVIFQLSVLLFCVGVAKSQVKKSIEIGAPTQAILFVTNASDKSTDFMMRLHDQKANEIIRQIPYSTTKLLVTKTDAQQLTFIVNKSKWTLDVATLKQRNAMILFDGQNKPKVIYDSQTYLHAAKFILENNKQTPVQKKALQYDAKQFFDSIAAIPFKPSRQYAEGIISRSSLPIYSTQKKGKYDGTYISQTFTGENLEKPSGMITTVYQQGKELSANNLSNGINFYTKYFYNKWGLIDSIQQLQNSKWSSSTIYQYLPHAILITDPERRSASIHHLNDQYQVVREESIHFVYQRMHWVDYRYNENGQLIEEVSGLNDAIENRRLYYYDNPKADNFSSWQVFDATGKLTAESKIAVQGNESTYLFYRDGTLELKIVSKEQGDYQYESTVFDKQNKITSKTIQTKKSSSNSQ
ncbi:hypothetical protein [Sphingobacterium sp. DR205]|uniref:hypothetical protein n=1 Tax=Sphingobacterium sp. DR205 TaxID=2713573 RepID=UPI0013E49DAB|nr:hypothetical protein [Sphingobacterium sp. DR205]QIH33050.1 hypothetical protein G6053_09225 [Sphingobacterium sp. DR205]